MRSIIVIFSFLLSICSFVFSLYHYFLTEKLIRDCIILENEISNIREYAEQICAENRAMAYDFSEFLYRGE